MRVRTTIALLACAATMGCEFITGTLEPEATSQTDGSSTSSTGSTSEDVDRTGSTSTTSLSSSSSSSDSTSSEDDAGSVSSSTSSDRDSDLCCTIEPGPGCIDPEVESCVCSVDPYCCETQWDLECVRQHNRLGCGAECPIPMPPANDGPCCEETLQGGVGCKDPRTSDCVCAIDPYCCEEEWDALCVDVAASAQCDACEFKNADPSCCFPQANATCEETEIAACVCAIDTYCCEEQWDAQCAIEVERFGCGLCDGGTGTGTGSGTGSSSGSSSSDSGSVETYDGVTSDPT